MYQETVKDEEAQLLAAISATPAPVPIRYAYLWKAAKTIDDAFEFDPLMLYIRAGVKPPPRTARRARNFVASWQWKIRKTMLTVNNGSAIVVAFLDLDEPKTPFERLFDFLALQVWRSIAGEPTAEQQKRLDEADTKMRSVIDDTIGDRIGDMIAITLLATEPASQGRGYGGSLVEAINDICPFEEGPQCPSPCPSPPLALLKHALGDPAPNSPIRKHRLVGQLFCGGAVAAAISGGVELVVNFAFKYLKPERQIRRVEPQGKIREPVVSRAYSEEI